MTYACSTCCHHTQEGVVLVLSLETLSESASFRDGRECILDVKFSPDGLTLAAASADGTIYLYRCEGRSVVCVAKVGQ